MNFAAIFFLVLVFLFGLLFLYMALPIKSTKVKKV
jgi:hypothetical protein